MDELAKGVQEKVSWCMMFVDYVVLVEENTQVLEDTLERWKEVFEKNELKINRTKAEFLEFWFVNGARSDGSEHGVLSLENNFLITLISSNI